MRWVILGLLTGFSVVSYVQRVNISIAAKLMMPELDLNEIQMGQIFSSFMVGYAAFQVVTGVLGDRLGPRIVLTVAALIWGVMTILTGVVPGILITTGTGVMVCLLGFRFLLGVGEAATYPVAARMVANWIPAPERALGNAIVLTGMPLGSAVTPPLVSWLMVTVGWRESFYLTSVLAFLIAIVWWYYATDSPESHPKINESEVALIRAGDDISRPHERTSKTWWTLLKNRNVYLLSLSYFFEGYVLFMFVFWLYLYLVDVRGFSILSGGIFASLPWLTAMVLTPLGGVVCDKLSVKRGRLPGSRILVMSVYALSAIFLLVGAFLDNRYAAVGALCLSVGFLMSAESGFWSSAIHVSGSHAGAACGIMNMAGILGGVISTALVPILVKHFGWFFALGAGSAIALACALVWLGIRSEVPNPGIGARGTTESAA